MVPALAGEKMVPGRGAPGPRPSAGPPGDWSRGPKRISTLFSDVEVHDSTKNTGESEFHKVVLPYGARDRQTYFLFNPI